MNPILNDEIEKKDQCKKKTLLIRINILYP